MNRNISILVVVTVVASWFWFIAKQWIGDSGWSIAHSQDWLWPILVLALLVAVKANAYLLLNGSQWRWGVLVAAALPFLVLFGFQWTYTFGAVAIVIFNFFAMESIRDETTARVRISVVPMLKRGIPALVTAILLATSFAYYESPAVQASVSKQELPPVIAETVRGVTRQLLESELRNIPSAQRTAAENEVVRQAMTQLNGLVRPYRQFLPPVLAIGLFVILQGIHIVFLWPAVLIGWTLFEGLKRTHVVRIERSTIEAERIVS